MDFIGDIGGVSEVFIFMLGIFIIPFSKFSFVLKAVQKLFLAKTKDGNIFDQKGYFKSNGKRRFSTLKRQASSVL